MKTMSGVLLLVVGLVATTYGSNVPDFTEEVLQALQLTDSNVEKNDAELINPNVKVQFETGGTPQSDGVTLFAISKPDHSQPHETCDDNLGIKLENGTTACDILYFRLKTEKKNDVDSVLFVTFFGSGKDKPLLVITPVFKIPSAQAAGDKQQTWANSNKVGLLSPVDSQTLEGVKESKAVTLDFEWLNKLLPYGLFRRENSKYWDVFVSRPIAMPEGILDELVQVVESKKEKDGADDFFSFSNYDSEYLSSE